MERHREKTLETHKDKYRKNDFATFFDAVQGYHSDLAELLSRLCPNEKKKKKQGITQADLSKYTIKEFEELGLSKCTSTLAFPV